MQTYHTVIIGGGAAGICAAISSARAGNFVVICEKTSRIGKKLLATGNGRCNLLNDDLEEVDYNPTAREMVSLVFSKFGKNEILEFFKDLGLETYSDGGRIFPRTNQAASVLHVLEMEIKRLNIPVEFLFDCSGIRVSGDKIEISSTSGKIINCRKVIITGGGKTYPSTGSDGSMYEVARKLGHTIIEPVPAAVPVEVDDNLCRQLQGQRIQAVARSIIEGKKGDEAAGELLFTKYGLSGTCILDISESISIALNRLKKNEVFVSVDMVPFMKKEQLRDELEARRRKGLASGEMLAGLLPDKFGTALKDLFERDEIDSAVVSLKDRRFKVAGTHGWNEAECTCGGIAVDEINPQTLESKLKKNIYFAGEVVDINGRRGGYNLAWAWASGFVAGRTP